MVSKKEICSRDAVSRRKMDDEYVGLPADFDINDNITTLTQQMKRVPLAMYFYNLIMRMEKGKARREGRT